MDEAAKQGLRVKEESHKAYSEEELSLRKHRKEIHQAEPWRLWAAGEWCWCWRSGKHKGSRMKGGVFLGPARVLIQERETTAEGVCMKGIVWITEGTSLVRCAVQHLRSFRPKRQRGMHCLHFWPQNSYFELLARYFFSPQFSICDNQVLTSSDESPGRTIPIRS